MLVAKDNISQYITGIVIYQDISLNYALILFINLTCLTVQGELQTLLATNRFVKNKQKKTPIYNFPIPQHNGLVSNWLLGLISLVSDRMSELDKKKAELGFWEKVFFALFTAIFAVAGWFSSNYKDADVALLITDSVSSPPIYLAVFSAAASL